MGTLDLSTNGRRLAAAASMMAYVRKHPECTALLGPECPRARVLDLAVRLEARESSLPYPRALKAMLSLVNEAEEYTVRLIRQRFQQLSRVTWRSPNATERPI